MPAAKPPEFRRRAVDLVHRGEQSVPQIAKDLGISESCLRRWVAVDDVDTGRKEGVSSDERKELVELRRRNRVNRPGMSGDSEPWKGWGHVQEHEVSGRAA